MVTGIIEFGSKIGFSNNIGTGNFRILANATVVNPSGEQVRIVSTSTSDSSSGIEIRKIKIVYFDNSWTLKMQNHHYAKSIADASWYQIQMFTTYKAEWAGKNVDFVGM